MFGDRFYVEIQRVGRAGEEEYIGAVLQLLTAHPAPVVATNDVRYLQRDDVEPTGHLHRIAHRPHRHLDNQARHLGILVEKEGSSPRAFGIARDAERRIATLMKCVGNTPSRA